VKNGFGTDLGKNNYWIFLSKVSLNLFKSRSKSGKLFGAGDLGIWAKNE
jgi:hypothetical protein